MNYTSYAFASDQDVVRQLARGPWQERLADGLEAWDGSTIENEEFIKKAMEEGRTETRYGSIKQHIQNRRDWTVRLVDRIKEAGLRVTLDGPNARIEPKNDAPDMPLVEEIAKQNGIDSIPVIFHSIVPETRVGEVPIFRCVVSANRDGMRVVRTEKYVVGRPDVRCNGRDRVVETLRKAVNLAKKVEAARVFWDDQSYRIRKRDEARRAAEEAEKREAAIREEDEFAIGGCFNPTEGKSRPQNIPD